MPSKDKELNNRQQKKNSKKKDKDNGKYNQKHIRIQEKCREVLNKLIEENNNNNNK